MVINALIMKQIYTLCTLVLFLVACSREDRCELHVADGPSFTACTEYPSALTRTSLGGDLSSVWSAGDQIAVFHGSSQASRYQVENAYAGLSHANYNIVEAASTGGDVLAANVAVYPYQEGINCAYDGESYIISGFAYPAVQQYCADSFAEGAYAMAAVTAGTSDHDLMFRNVGGAIKLRLVGNDAVSRVSVSGKNGERLSGEAVVTVYPDGSAPTVQMSEAASGSVSLDCGYGVQLSPTVPISFYVAVPPTVFENGFTVEIENVDGDICTLEASAMNVVDRSKILSMPVASATFGGNEAVEGDYVDEYGVNHGQGVVIDGLRWAPVNCGFKEDGIEKGYIWGKMYQWGRLYGVGYNTTYDGSVAVNVAGGAIIVAEANMEANANIFYTMTSGNNQSHWFADTELEGVWNDGTASAPVKSANDPCPAGWRIPTQTEMKNLTTKRSAWTAVNGQNGFWYSGSTAYADGVPAIFLPAAGYISESGRAQVRNIYGRYWTSTVRTTTNQQVYQLAFSSSNSNVVLTGSVYGSSVRCVAE